MFDPTKVGPPTASLSGGGTEPQARPAEEPHKPSLARKLMVRGAAVGAAATNPILLERAQNAYDYAANGILRARQDPERLIGERTVMASLDDFLEKKASMPPPVSGIQDVKAWPTGKTIGVHAAGYGLKGFAEGAGSEVAKALMYGISRLAGGVGRALVGDPKRRDLLQKVLTTDPVLSDALQRSPSMTQNLLEAYGTLNKFAPTLATDVNAVRSFLREVVLGGGHVNYATIKNLIETEKGLHGNQPMYGGIH